MFADRVRRRYLARHALDLWYIATAKAVSLRAVRVLRFVRRWQRDGAWVARVARQWYRRIAHDASRHWCSLCVCVSDLVGSSDPEPEYVIEPSSSETSAVESERSPRYRFLRYRARITLLPATLSQVPLSRPLLIIKFRGRAR